MGTQQVRPLGEQIRHWRRQRRLSQMDLALDAEISTRHLSFIETGRAQPSREMVLLLAEQLEHPHRPLDAAEPHEVTIDLDPGMAFGTGLHETTAGCLELLVEEVTPGARVADVGCGHGHSTLLMAQAFPHSRFHGFDISEAMLDG